MSNSKSLAQPQQPNNSLWSWIIIIAGVVLFGAFALLPFLVRSYATIGTVFAGPGTKLHGCISAPGVASVHECAIWNPPQSSQLLGLVGVVVFVALGLLTLWRVPGAMPFSKLRRLMLTHILVATVAVAGFSSAYFIIRNSSQDNAVHSNLSALAEESYQLGLRAYAECNSPQSALDIPQRRAACARADFLLGTRLSAPNNVLLPKSTSKVRYYPTFTLGYGVLPEYIVLVGALYLIAPLLNCYRFLASPKRIRGQKKEKLFV